MVNTGFGPGRKIGIFNHPESFYELIGISKDKFSRYNGNRLSTICNLNDLCRMNEKLAKAEAEHDNIIYLESRIDCGQQDTRWMLLHIYYNKNNGTYLSFMFDFSCYFGQDSDSYFHTRDLAVALKRAGTDAFSYITEDSTGIRLREGPGISLWKAHAM